MNNGFVYSGGALAETKHNPIAPPADTSGYIDAATVNLLNANTDSLRQAVTAGDFHGLRNTSAGAPGVSNAGEVRVRSNAGALEISQNGGAWTSLNAIIVSVSGGGSLAGDVTGSVGASVVSAVGGSSAAAVHAAEVLANAATSANTAGTIVKRDGAGSFSATTVTAALVGNVTGNVTGNLTGNVAGSITFPDATVQTTAAVGTSLAAVGSAPNANGASVVSGVLNLQPADGSNPGVVTTGAQTIAGAKTFSSAIVGSVTGSAGSFTGSLVGDVTGTQGATVVSAVGGSTAASIHTSQLATAAATSSATPSTLVLRDGSNNASLNVTGSITQVGGCTAQALASPVNGTFTAGAGTLTAGTKYYRVSALWNDGETVPSTETSITVGASTGVNVTWATVTGATGYRIYGRTTGAELLLATVGLVTTWLDDGSLTPTGAMPALNTTGGLSMPGNQTYTGTGGVLFNTPNTSNSAAACFTYRAPVGWTGANSAGAIVDYQDGNKNSLFKVDRFGSGQASGQILAPKYSATSGQPVQIQGNNNDGADATGTYVTNVTQLVVASSKILALRNGGIEFANFSNYGVLNGSIAAIGLGVSPLGIPQNGGTSSTDTSSGTLTAGTYYYRITAVNFLGESLPSVERSIVLGATGRVRPMWACVPGAVWYRIYGRTTGAEQLLATVDSNDVTLFTNQALPGTVGYYLAWWDNGSVTPSGALPTSNTSAGVVGGFSVKALPTPTLDAFSAGAGTLAAATYYYRVSALNDFGETLACTEGSYVLASTGGVNVNWKRMPGVKQYKVYGRTTGAELLIAAVDAPVCTYLDNGSITPSGALPSGGNTASITVAGTVESTAGGFKFPDGTTQTTAAAIGTDTRFQHYADAGNTSTTETDLYSDTTVANALGSNGSALFARYAGSFVNSTSTKQLKIYFAGTVIFDSGALSVSAASDWNAEVMIVRESSTVYRATVSVTLTGASTGDFANYLRVTGVNLATTNILKITGTAAGVGAATNDIVASVGLVWQP